MIVVTYKGKPYSLNEAYNLHWAKRAKRKKDILFQLNIKHNNPTIDEYGVTLAYNSRIDLDNTTPLIKLALDHLRRKGLLIDDSPKYFKSLSIINDDTLERDSYIITITSIN